MEWITKANATEVLRRLAQGEIALVDAQKWSTRILVGNECEVSDADAAIVAAVVNVFEDDTIATDDVLAAAESLRFVLSLTGRADDEIVDLVTLITQRRRFSELFHLYAVGRVSVVALGNALSKTRLSGECQKRMAAMERAVARQVAHSLERYDAPSLIESLRQRG